VLSHSLLHFHTMPQSPLKLSLFPYTTLFRSQVILQTWHGTPIKRLLFDAPPAFTPLVYRRLMARQAEQWDVLLVQDEEAELRLRSEEHTSELQSRFDLVCRLLLEKKNEMFDM